MNKIYQYSGDFGDTLGRVSLSLILCLSFIVFTSRNVLIDKCVKNNTGCSPAFGMVLIGNLSSTSISYSLTQLTPLMLNQISTVSIQLYI